MEWEVILLQSQVRWQMGSNASWQGGREGRGPQVPGLSPGCAWALGKPLSSHQVGAFATTCVAFKFLGASFNLQHGIYLFKESVKIRWVGLWKAWRTNPKDPKKRKKKSSTDFYYKKYIIRLLWGLIISTCKSTSWIRNEWDYGCVWKEHLHLRNTLKVNLWLTLHAWFLLVLKYFSEGFPWWSRR